MPLAIPRLTALPPPSALVLSDRLLCLAEAAESAGCHITAEHLLALAHTVFDDTDDTEQSASVTRAATPTHVRQTPYG
jgi:hypothetical protein